MLRMKDTSGFSYLNESRTNEKFCDVIIRVEDRTFPCHRNILYSTMRYFRSMLSGDYVEAESQEIKLNNVKADDFEHLLTFIYGSSVPVGESNILRLLVLANYLGLQTMEDACIENIAENNALYSLDSVVNIFRFACAVKNTSLVEVLLKPMAENFVHAAESRKLYRVPSEELLKILAHPNLNYDITAILDFLKEWSKFQIDAEKKLIPEILSVVKVEGNLRNWILKTLMNSENESNSTRNVHGNDLQGLLSDLEKDNSKITAQPPLLLFANNSIYSGTRVYEFQSAKNQVKCFDIFEPPSEGFLLLNKSFSIGDTQLLLFSRDVSVHLDQSGTSGNCHYISFYAKNRSSRSSNNEFALINYYRGVKFDRSKLIEGDENFNIFTTAINGAHIYLYNNIEFIMYALDQNEWFTIQGYENIFAPSMLSHGSCLYMIGGLDFSPENPIKSRHSISKMQPGTPSENNGKLFKCYDVREGKWSQLPNMKYVRCKAASCVYNDTIYVSGGDYMTYYENSNVEYYDIRAGKWSEFTTPMPKAKMGHCCMSYNDNLWFFGGRELLSHVFDSTWFSYDLKGNTWSKISTIPTKCDDYKINRIYDVLPGVNI